MRMSQSAFGASIVGLLMLGAAHVEAQICVQAPVGLVGWWAGNGNPTDLVAGNNGQLSGDATFASAAVGQGFRLDGVGDYIEIPDSPTLKPPQMSVEAWVRFDSLDTPIVSQAGAPGLQYIVFKKNSRVFNFEAYALRKERTAGVDRLAFSVADINGFGNIVYSTTAVVVGTFYHVVGTYDGAFVRLFVNGVLQGQEPVSVTVDYGTRPVFIGTSGETVFDGKLNGIVDEASIYDRAIDSAEAAGLHAAGTAGKCSSGIGLPAAVDDSFATTAGAPVNAPAPGVLANDNPNGDGVLTAQLVNNVAHGALILNADGGFAYTPTPGYTGIDTFTYRAVNSLGSSYVATVTISVGAQPPTALHAATIAGNVVTLRWNTPALGPAPTGYVLEGGIDPGQVLASINTGSASPVFTFTAPSGAFYLRVHTLAGANRSVASNEIRLFVNVPTAPSAPGNLLGLVDGANLSLAWRNTYGGGAPTGLVLDVSGSASLSVPLSLAESFTFAGVPGGAYTFSLRATNAAGVSSPSNPVSLTFPGGCSGAPLTPANFLATRNGNQITVRWDLPLSGPAPAGFVLNVTGSFVGGFPTTLRSLSAAASPGAYTFTVSATNPCGGGPPTAPQTVVIP